MISLISPPFPLYGSICKGFMPLKGQMCLWLLVHMTTKNNLTQWRPNLTLPIMVHDVCPNNEIIGPYILALSLGFRPMRSTLLFGHLLGGSIYLSSNVLE